MKTLPALAVLLFFGCNAENSSDRVKPVLSDITESVYASVTVRPEISYFPQSLNTGILQEIAVAEGDTVQEGQLLFTVSVTPSVLNRVTTAELNLAEAKSNYRGKDNLLLNLEVELASVKEQLMLDSITFDRQQRLWQQKIGKESDLDRARLAYQSSQNKLQLSLKQYTQAKANLATNYQKAASQVKAERALLGDFKVHASMGGKVYRISKEIGDLITTQEKFLEIGSADQFIIEMDIDEVDITKIGLGDTVAVALEAYPGQVFLAKTIELAPKKDDFTQTFRVESTFINKPPRLYNGLSGEANIIVSTRQHAMVIPADYLLPGNKVLTDAGEVEVKIGVKNIQFVELLSGVDTSTSILKPAQ